MSERLRILVVTSSLSGGGAGNHILNLCRYLKSVSIDPSILTISQRRHELEDELESAGIPIYRHSLKSLSGLAAPGSISGLREIIGRTNPDIVHGHLYHGEMTASVISRLAGVPMVTTRHSSGLEFNGCRKWLSRIAARRIGAAIAVSRDAAREAVATGIPADKITVLPNGVDARRFKMLEESDRVECKGELIRELFPGDFPSDAILVGAAGALKDVKNHSLFIRIASRVLSSSPLLRKKLRFVVVGEGELRKGLEAQVAGMELTDCVSLPGYINGLDDFFPCLDIFLVTSKSEGVPIALLEAMSSGAACVSNDVGDIAEVMKDTGFIIPLNEEDMFVDIVSRLVADEVERREIGRRARVRILEHFDIEIWGNRTVEVYEGLIGRDARRSP